MTSTPSLRSPAAARFDPTARKWQGTAPDDLGPEAFEGWLCSGAALDAPAFHALLRHGGLWVERHRWAGEGVARGAVVTAYAFSIEPEDIEITRENVLLDLEDLVAVAKPAWLCTQGTRASDWLSLESKLRALLGRPELVAAHRLDRETSGVVLFSRPGAVAAALHAQFRAGTVEKVYHARVERPLLEAVTVEGPMVRVAHPHHSLFALVPGAVGQASRSDFRPLDAPIVEARPHTGRTHQLRVHLAWLGHPIAGDTLYNRPWTAGQAERTLLHAHRLKVVHGGREWRIEAPDPTDF